MSNQNQTAAAVGNDLNTQVEALQAQQAVVEAKAKLHQGLLSRVAALTNRARHSINRAVALSSDTDSSVSLRAAQALLNDGAKKIGEAADISGAD